MPPFTIKTENKQIRGSEQIFQMCGIAGILARNTQIPAAVLEQATRSLTHRGPDDSGTVLLQEAQPEPLELGLGHTRSGNS